MKAMVIQGAPRMDKGNTHLVLSLFLEGMQEGGATTHVEFLASREIEPCIGCFTCYATTPGQCVYDDHMPDILEKIADSDLIIVATPVYLDGMTSLTKIFVDRTVMVMDPHFEKYGKGLRHPLRKTFPSNLFLVSVCGYPGLHNFDPLVLHMERIARNFHANFCGALLRPAIFSLLLTKKYPDRIQEIREAIKAAGRELAVQGNVSSQTLKTAAQDICSTEELMKTANGYWDRLLSENRE